MDVKLKEQGSCMLQIRHFKNASLESYRASLAYKPGNEAKAVVACNATALRVCTLVLFISINCS